MPLLIKNLKKGEQTSLEVGRPVPNDAGSFEGGIRLGSCSFLRKKTSGKGETERKYEKCNTQVR